MSIAAQVLHITLPNLVQNVLGGVHFQLHLCKNTIKTPLSSLYLSSISSKSINSANFWVAIKQADSNLTDANCHSGFADCCSNLGGLNLCEMVVSKWKMYIVYPLTKWNC